MAIYNYSDTSLINEVEIIKNAQGGCRAYLRARSDCTPQQLLDIQQKLVNRDWVGIPCYREGKHMLEVRGFTKPEELRAFLQVSGCTTGEHTSITETPADKQSFRDKLGAATLKYSGISYLLGDAAFMFYATRELMQHHKDHKLALEAQSVMRGLNIGGMDEAAKLSKLTELKGSYRTIEKIAGETKDLAVVAEKIEELPGLFKSTISGGRFKIVAGIGYGIGSLILAGFASRDQSHIQIGNSIKQIDRFIKSEGLRDPNSGNILLQEPEKKNKNILDHCYDALSRYPSEALNIVYTGVGLALMNASFKQVSSLGARIKSLKDKKGWEREVKDLRQERSSEITDIGLGTITASSALAGILIKEKKPLEGEKRREGLIEGTWDAIQEKPLRLTGAGLMAATGVHAVATVQKWKPFEGELAHELKDRRITLMGRIGFIAVNILAETLMVLSSKGHGEGVKNHDVDDTVIASAAEFISRQNPAMQDILIQRLSGYMASPKVLGGKADDIAVGLRSQLEALKTNPWAHAVAPVKERLSKMADVTMLPAASITQTQPAAPTSRVGAIELDGTIHSRQLASSVS